MDARLYRHPPCLGTCAYPFTSPKKFLRIYISVRSADSRVEYKNLCFPVQYFCVAPLVGDRSRSRCSLRCTASSEGSVDNGNGAYSPTLPWVSSSSSSSSMGSSIGNRNNGTLFFGNLAPLLVSIRSFLPGGSWWKLHGFIDDSSCQTSFMSAMQRFRPLMAPDAILIGAAFVALIVAALSEIAIPHYMAATIFCVQSGLRHEFIQNTKHLAFFTLMFGLFSGLRGGCFGVANQILVRRMREKLYTTLLYQEMSFFDKEPVGILTSRLGSDCQKVSQIISKDLNIMLRNALQGLGSLLYLTRISWSLALSTFTICMIMLYIMQLYGKYQRVAAKSGQDLVASANEVAEESFSLAAVVRVFGTESQEFTRYKKWTEKLFNVNLRQNVAYGLWNWSSQTLYHATQVVALIIGGSYVLMGKISAEQLTKFIFYSEWVVGSIWWVGDHWASLMQSIGASEEVFRLMQLPPSKQLIAGGNMKSNISEFIFN
ncbi:hypothetical protein KP509_01G060800 [Ceratopteris richardii]|uniref:ABC transmembrane type-1 domain-containing protein n=1 Tax=Ceratopteris richardii TaxID=49495 RepID=A0A8T2VDF9_CERRI|nr:hypothetical protein KP509_01G060800 [Ceratopteris richardii]